MHPDAEDFYSTNGCSPYLKSEQDLVTLHKLLASYGTQKQSDDEFLAHIYDQIDSLLNRCLAQSNSRSNTPLSALRQTPPVYGGKTFSAQRTGPSAERLHISKTSTSFRNESRSRAPPNSSITKTPRRVQLFATTDNSGTSSQLAVSVAVVCTLCYEFLISAKPKSLWFGLQARLVFPYYLVLLLGLILRHIAMAFGSF